MFCLAELEAHLWSTARNTFLYPEEQRVAEVLPQNEREGRRALEVLEAHLATTVYLVADRFSVTDIIIGYAIRWARRAGWADGLARCGAYVERLEAMPLCPYGKDAA